MYPSVQDGRLRSGDHILRIGDTDLFGLGSDQVAQVLRQCGNKVQLLISRATVDDASPSAVPLPTLAEQVNTPNTQRIEIAFFHISLTKPKCCFQQGQEEEEQDLFDVCLTKNAQGLGITIAGYIGDKNSGEFQTELLCQGDGKFQAMVLSSHS